MSGADRKTEIARVWRWREAICADRDLTDAAKVVGLRLSFHYDYDRRTVWAPEDRLAAECACHESTVQRARRRLVERGALHVVETARRNRATRYGLADPAEWGSATATPGSPDGVAPQLPQDEPGDELGSHASSNGVARLQDWGSTPAELGSHASYPSSTRGVPVRVAPRGTTTGEAAEADPARAPRVRSPRRGIDPFASSERRRDRWSA